MSVKEMAAALAAARERVVCMKADKERLEAEFHERNKTFLEVYVMAEKDLALTEESLRVEVMNEHSRTGQLKFEAGIQVKQMESLEYDNAKALEWARENMKAAVKTVLDIKTFEAFAKSSPLPGLVDVKKTPKVFIPKYLEVEK